ncbi:MAG: hypothetical protein ACR2N7_12210 [Acidimicrobiia bacterium]
MTPTKRSTIVALMVCLAVVLAACSSSEPSEEPTGGVFTVEYKVSSPDQTSAEITYTFNGGSDVFRGTENLPFEETFEMNGGDLVDLGALSTDGNNVTCRVNIDGKKYLENTAQNGKVAVCQGVVSADSVAP